MFLHVFCMHIKMSLVAGRINVYIFPRLSSCLVVGLEGRVGGGMTTAVFHTLIDNFTL